MALDAEHVSRALRLSNSERVRIGIGFGMFSWIKIGMQRTGGMWSSSKNSWLRAPPDRATAAIHLDKGSETPFER
jgi:hypothetical protein